jgi:hypothetical protein
MKVIVKPRHAATLALVGWYLMVPPRQTAMIFDTDAPLSKWSVYAGFDNAVTCDKVQASEEHDWKQKSKADPSNEIYRSLMKQLLGSQCIATDDPRLKGN